MITSDYWYEPGSMTRILYYELRLPSLVLADRRKINTLILLLIYL